MGKESLTKEELKERLDGNELDLSLCTLAKVPVREIALLPKATILDLSCNDLTTLPTAFSSLTQLTRLDLSKNNLTELPNDFGQLINLERLDLYSNNLSCLPVSCYRLKKLKWLDVKKNPMETLLSDIVGKCLTDEECKQCAINVVAHLKNQNAEQERSRQKRLKKEREKRAEQDAQEQELRKRQKLLEKEERRAAFQEMERQKRKIIEEERKPCLVVENNHLNNGIEEKPLKSTKGRVSYFHIFITICLVICFGLVAYYGYRTIKANHVL